MDRAVFPIENHKDAPGAVVDGFECDRCSTLFGTAEGGGEPFLRNGCVRVYCLGFDGRRSSKMFSLIMPFVPAGGGSGERRRPPVAGSTL
jgi:hypothetical protein